MVMSKALASSIATSLSDLGTRERAYLPLLPPDFALFAHDGDAVIDQRLSPQKLNPVAYVDRGHERTQCGGAMVERPRGCVEAGGPLTTAVDQYFGVARPGCRSFVCAFHSCPSSISARGCVLQRWLSTPSHRYIYCPFLFFDSDHFPAMVCFLLSTNGCLDLERTCNPPPLRRS